MLKEKFLTPLLLIILSVIKKQMTDILLNVRDENSPTVTRKVFIPLNF